MKKAVYYLIVIGLILTAACSQDNPIAPGRKETVMEPTTVTQTKPTEATEPEDATEPEPSQNPSEEIPREHQEYPNTHSSRYTCTLEWGEMGAITGEFYRPTFLALDGRKLYVSDFGNHRVQVFDADGCFLRELGESGREEGQFKYPQGIAVDNLGNVYVSDIENTCIQKFTSSGNFVKRWSARSYAEAFTPSGIAIREGRLYATDPLNHRIRIFTSDGNILDEWGSTQSDTDGEFHYPNGIAVDNSGYVYVADFGNNRIQKLTSEGTFVTKWGSKGNAEGQFTEPCNVAVDNTGNVYVADTQNNRIQKFNADGGFITQWTSEDGRIEPYGIAIDNFGNVYVSDNADEGSRIMKFSPTR